MPGPLGRVVSVQAGVQLGDRYELVGLIAAGGMGEVWHARDITLLRAVAVKVLGLPEGLVDARARLEEVQPGREMLSGVRPSSRQPASRPRDRSVSGAKTSNGVYPSSSTQRPLYRLCPTWARILSHLALRRERAA